MYVPRGSAFSRYRTHGLLALGICEGSCLNNSVDAIEAIVLDI
jgi:hypothetical protein